MSGSGRDHEVGLRERVAGLPSVLNEKPPSQHDVFSDVENSILEHGADFVREPFRHFGSPRDVGRDLDAKTNVGESDNADIKTGEWPSRYEPGNASVRFRAPYL